MISPLTVTPLSGGDGTITAGWSLWSDPMNYPAYQFGVGDSCTLHIEVAGPNITTDSNNNGIIEPRIDDRVEDKEPGNIVSVHEDGASDLSEVDLEIIGITPTDADQYFAELSISNDKISLWADAAGTIPITSLVWDLFADAASLPSSIYVKGLKVGTSAITWTIMAGSQVLSSDVVKESVIDLKSLTVTDCSNSARTTTSTSTNPPIKDIYAAVNYADGYMHIDLTASVAGTKAAEHVCWSISSGNLPPGSNGKTSISDVKLRAGDYIIQVWLDINPANKIQINVHRYWTFTEVCAVLARRLMAIPFRYHRDGVL